jgi:hypothetical protein
MATDKQTEANRLNAQKSTGPRSVEGKAASSQNALKSGIDAQSQIIRGEDPIALAALTNEYLVEYQPRFASERSLVDILIDTEWLLRRLRKAEAQLWNHQFDELDDWRKVCSPKDPISPDRIQGRAFLRAEQTFARLERRRDTLQRAFRRTVQDLHQIQASRPPKEAQPEWPLGPPCASGPQVPPPEPPVGPPQGREIGFVPQSPAVVPSSNPTAPVSNPPFRQRRHREGLRQHGSDSRPKPAPVSEPGVLL